MMYDSAEIVFLIEEYARVTGCEPQAVATRIFNDGKSYRRLKNGGDLYSRSCNRAGAWLRAEWPADLEFPEFPRDGPPPSGAENGDNAARRQRLSTTTTTTPKT